MTKRLKESAPAEGIIPVAEPAIETVTTAEPQVEASAPKPSSQPGFGQQAGRVLSFLVRLVFILILGGAIGAGLYFGVPFVYQKYILPVQQNTTQLTQLQTRQGQSEQKITALETRLNAVATEQAQHAQALTNLDGRLVEIETEIVAHTQSLAALEQMQSTLQAANDATNAEVLRQISLMKSMELLSRARLFLYQSNFGLAKQDVQTARDLLATVQPDASKLPADELAAIIQRLDLTLTNLPNFPVAASDDLDIAWQILLGGLPPAEPTPAPTIPALEATPTPVPTASP
jgi:hypothetical protein